MGDILRIPNGKALFLTPRSGSHSIAVATLQKYWPEKYNEWTAISNAGHPAAFLPHYESFCGQDDLAIVVRNPIERFRSLCAHRLELNVDQHIANPCYGPLPSGNFIKYFLFENGLDDVAEWLELSTPLPVIDATDETTKPTLTEQQLFLVKKIYAKDIELWESLNARYSN